MANNRCTYQQNSKVSVPKLELVNIATRDELGKKDLKVLLILLSELDGWCPSSIASRENDPCNYKKIDVEQIADTLDFTESEVEKCLKKLVNEGIVERGKNNVVSKGYRFTF